jgi:signal transduction histidine kinase/DNA-binding NarL/FixJ family response regulator
MFDFKGRFAFVSIRSKIITAFLFGCLVVVFAWIIARIVFKETFHTIEEISRPNPKLLIINDLFQKIQHLDYSQKVQVIKIQEQGRFPGLAESNPIIQLLDSLETYCEKDTLQAERIERMKDLLHERDALFFNYLKYRYGLLKNNPLSKDISLLSEYISKNLKGADSNVVRTTRRNIVTTTLIDPEEDEKKSDKRESLLKRMFSRKKSREDSDLPPKKLVTENIQETIDTFAVTQRDSFMKDMERAMISIEKNRFDRHTKLIDHELKLASASKVFIDELEQLLRQVQTEEIRELQRSTASLSGVFNRAFSWIEIILCTFLSLILLLILLIFSDISRSNRIKQELIDAKEKAEFLEQVKHRFLANMSHEIRTPLQAIIGYSEQVKDQEKPQKQALEAIYRSSEHLLQIVNEVLDYSRIVSGKFVFEKHHFDMQELIAEVADIMEGQAEKKNIAFRLKTEIPGNHLYSGDAFRLKQILFNLLGNAIKFTNYGEVTFLVTARQAGRKKTAFRFEIRDTGIGMSEEELKRVFNSFEQASENTQKKYGGTGLGLSIAKKLVEMQGGTLQVSSEKHKGSSFIISLFYLNAPPVLQSRTESPAPLHLAEAFKVLVVDDDAFILQLCSALLSKHQIPHLCYNSPEKVLEAAWDDTVNLVLMDIRMPGMNGPELFQRLKQKVSPDVRFIALTAQALPEEKDSVLSLGFDQVLLKPFREKDLIEAIQQGISSPSVAPPLPGRKAEDLPDLSSIESMCMHDPELIRQTIGLLIREMNADLEELQEGIRSEDPGRVVHAVHKLSAKTGQTGFHLLSREMKDMERVLRSEPGVIMGDPALQALPGKIRMVIGLLEKHST